MPAAAPAPRRHPPRHRRRGGRRRPHHRPRRATARSEAERERLRKRMEARRAEREGRCRRAAGSCAVGRRAPAPAIGLTVTARAAALRQRAEPDRRCLAVCDDAGADADADAARGAASLCQTRTSCCTTPPPTAPTRRSARRRRRARRWERSWRRRWVRGCSSMWERCAASTSASAPPMVVVVADDEVERVHLHRLCLELKHNPAATFVRGHGYVRPRRRTFRSTVGLTRCRAPAGWTRLRRLRLRQRAAEGVREGGRGRPRGHRPHAAVEGGRRLDGRCRRQGGAERGDAGGARERKGEASLLDEPTVAGAARRANGDAAAHAASRRPPRVGKKSAQVAASAVGRRGGGGARFFLGSHAVDGGLSPHGRRSPRRARRRRRLQLSVVSSAAELADHLTSIKEATDADSRQRPRGRAARLSLRVGRRARAGERLREGVG